ncbi:conserved hypothetical protein [Trichinella spiralis]|uniref:hypothetical protein n=1 Tax=Trichinella spiralis TaxID=6334 RepID=UPI0001EFDFDA|nr:conserved hypothetical protein [Trichinella spiralis]
MAVPISDPEQQHLAGLALIGGMMFATCTGITAPVVTLLSVPIALALFAGAQKIFEKINILAKDEEDKRALAARKSVATFRQTKDSSKDNELIPICLTTLHFVLHHQ